MKGLNGTPRDHKSIKRRVFKATTWMSVSRIGLNLTFDEWQSDPKYSGLQCLKEEFRNINLHKTPFTGGDVTS